MALFEDVMRPMYDSFPFVADGWYIQQSSMLLTLSLPRDFRLWSLVLSHGWSVLPPFRIDRDRRSLGFASVLQSGNAVAVSVAERRRSLRCHVDSPTPLTNSDRAEVRTTIRSVLRLDEDLAPLHRVARRHPGYRWVPRFGAGRILRAPTAFEDTVKMICTTNCSWSLTVQMVTRLVGKLGHVVVGGQRAFPTPEAMASQPERFYRTVIRAGYRSPYLLELARRCVTGELNLERLRTETMTAEEKTALLRAIKGVGPYAADHLLRLHGVYDRFAHDSWITKQFAERYHGGRRVKDVTIERRYKEFGSFQGLMYWLDMTKEWYERDEDFSREVTA